MKILRTVGLTIPSTVFLVASISRNVSIDVYFIGTMIFGLVLIIASENE